MPRANLTRAKFELNLSAKHIKFGSDLRLMTRFDLFCAIVINRKLGAIIVIKNKFKEQCNE